jgi:hypothetical protein
MSKAVIELGYYKYIMSPEDAIKVISVLADAERYEAKYVGGEQRYMYHIWTAGEDVNDPTTHTLTIVPDALYRMAKLAGKPVKE